MQALDKERSEVAASTNNGRGPGRVSWSIGCKTCFSLFLWRQAKLWSRNQEEKKKRSNLIKEVEGLKTIYKGNISLSRFLSEWHQLDLHSYHGCMNKYRTFSKLKIMNSKASHAACHQQHPALNIHHPDKCSLVGRCPPSPTFPSTHSWSFLPASACHTASYVKWAALHGCAPQQICPKKKMRGCEGEGAVSKQTNTKIQYITEHIYSEGGDLWEEEWLNTRQLRSTNVLKKLFPSSLFICVPPL